MNRALPGSPPQSLNEAALISMAKKSLKESVVLQEITKNMSEECQRQAEVGAATSASLLLSNSGLDILERRLSEIRGDLSMVMRDSESWIDERAHYMTLLSEERKNNLELTNELATLRYEQSEILTASTCEVEARKRAEIRAEEGKQARESSARLVRSLRDELASKEADAHATAMSMEARHRQEVLELRRNVETRERDASMKLDETLRSTEESLRQETRQREKELISKHEAALRVAVSSVENDAAIELESLETAYKRMGAKHEDIKQKNLEIEAKNQVLTEALVEAERRAEQVKKAETEERLNSCQVLFLEKESISRSLDSEKLNVNRLEASYQKDRDSIDSLTTKLDLEKRRVKELRGEFNIVLQEVSNIESKFEKDLLEANMHAKEAEGRAEKLMSQLEEASSEVVRLKEVVKHTRRSRPGGGTYSSEFSSYSPMTTLRPY